MAGILFTLDDEEPLPQEAPPEFHLLANPAYFTVKYDFSRLVIPENFFTTVH